MKNNLSSYTKPELLDTRISYEDCVLIYDVLGELAALLFDKNIDKVMMKEDITYLDNLLSKYNEKAITDSLLDKYREVLSDKKYTLNSMLIYETMCVRKSFFRTLVQKEKEIA